VSNCAWVRQRTIILARPPPALVMENDLHIKTSTPSPVDACHSRARSSMPRPRATIPVSFTPDPPMNVRGVSVACVRIPLPAWRIGVTTHAVQPRATGHLSSASISYNHPGFDDPNLGGSAGLVPLLRLAESAGLHDLVGETTAADRRVWGSLCPRAPPTTRGDRSASPSNLVGRLSTRR
jgi:hypothetical protein